MKIREGYVSNSSSSSFICNTNKIKKVVKQELEMILQLYNKLQGTSYTYDQVFAKLYYGNDEYTEWLKKGWGCNIGTKGKLIIDSAEDNSIPWAIVELIENVYDAHRVHLG